MALAADVYPSATQLTFESDFDISQGAFCRTGRRHLLLFPLQPVMGHAMQQDGGTCDGEYRYLTPFSQGDNRIRRLAWEMGTQPDSCKPPDPYEFCPSL